MAIIVVELNTDETGDLMLLDVINQTLAKGAPVEAVVTPPTPLKIVPQNIGEELKAELDAVPDPAKAFASPPAPAPTAITNPPAPTAITNPPPPPATKIIHPLESAVELDVDGLPWDARIHASTKTKIVSGQWKAKRKISADTLSIVTEELRNTMSAPPAVAPAPAPVPPAIIAQSPAVTTAPTTFEAFVVAMVKAGKTNADVEPLLVARGIKGINLLGARPDLIPEIWAELMV